jgi:single-stranded-DNA-specific exonuclease
MSQRKRIWERVPGDPQIAAELSTNCSISLGVAKALVNRGIIDEKSAGRFLAPDVADMHDPFCLPDMTAAAGRVLDAVRRGERIRIYGDYDVDGVSSVALAVSVLRAYGANVDYYIPNRLVEGYGLSIEAVQKAASDAVDVMITADCGIGAFKEAEAAHSLGVDLIITDHHEADEGVPQCVAVVNPKRHDSEYPFKELAGVGVIFKLCQALWRLAGRPDGQADPKSHLDLAALGTIADVVPLLDENRIIARAGLAMMGHSSNLGIQSLLDVAGLAGREVKAGNVGFTLGPRVNAAGRLGDPSLGARLFLTDSRQEASELAAMLDEENRKRQEIEQAILRQVWEPVSKMNTQSTRAIVLGSETWHTGVIGIVASKIAEMTFRPTVLVSFEGDVGRGSARSIPGFNLFSALTECSDLLLKYGGHAQAAGLSIRAADLEAFRERLNRIGHERLSQDDLVPRLRFDDELPEADISDSLARELAALEPHGLGNPSPVFVTRNMLVLEQRSVGADGRHLKLKLGRGDAVVGAIGFRMTRRYSEVARNSAEVDVAYSLDLNEWNGSTHVEMNLKDIRRSTVG